MDEVYRENSLSCGNSKRKIERTCAVCGSRFKPRGEHKNRIAKYCSKDCWSKRGKYRNKKCENCNDSIPMRAKRFCSRDCAFKFRKNKNHHAWKGEKASYSAAHKWMYKHFGKPEKCFYCSGTEPRVEWANISGSYMRDIKDWLKLCSSCHRFFDRNKEKRNVILSRWEKYTGKKAELVKQ